MKKKKDLKMNQTSKIKSTSIAATLLVGALFIISVTIQQLPSTGKLESPLFELSETESESYTDQIIIEKEIGLDEDLVMLEEAMPILVKISFADAFNLAREEFGPGYSFEWNENLYTTDRADDALNESTDSIQIVLDTTRQESSSAVDIEIVP